MVRLKITTPLVSVDWLSHNLNHPDLIILDATIPKVGQAQLSEEALTKRIPNARVFDLKNTFKDLDATLPNTMPSPKYFTTEAQKIGINNESIIVVYDHHGIYSSPRAWWVFRTMGHQNVAVLDGGFPAWKNANLPIAAKTISIIPSGDFEANFQNQLLIDANVLLQNLENPEIAILDARSEGRFTATTPEPRANLRGGHIPGSKNLPSSKIVKDGKMLPTEELKKVFDELDVDGKKVVFSCGSGITACVITLGAELAGHKEKSVFDGSWTEWGGNESLPIET